MLERIQRSAIKIIPELRNLSCEKRLNNEVKRRSKLFFLDINWI